VFFSKDIFKVIFKTMSTLITITFFNINYKVEFLFLCRKVVFNEIIGIQNHIFLSVIFSSIWVTKDTKASVQVAKINLIFFNKVQH